ncbi:hypothetical protein FB451DRAFT_1041408, partial [Mycena latifolia]
PCCGTGCQAIKDQHHVFVECPQYTKWRLTPPRTHINTRMQNSTRGTFWRPTVLLWPLHYSTFYLGHIPPFNHLMPKKIGNGNTLARTQLAHHIIADWHTTAIQLAGCIWGDWQRKMAKSTDTRRR